MGGREGGGVGGGGGWGAEGGLYHPQGDRQQQCVPSRARSLISAPQWPHAPCSGPTWFSRVGKGPPVKADLAIYRPVNGVYV